MHSYIKCLFLHLYCFIRLNLQVTCNMFTLMDVAVKSDESLMAAGLNGTKASVKPQRGQTSSSPLQLPKVSITDSSPDELAVLRNDQSREVMSWPAFTQTALGFVST